MNSFKISLGFTTMLLYSGGGESAPGDPGLGLIWYALKAASMASKYAFQWWTSTLLARAAAVSRGWTVRAASGLDHIRPARRLDPLVMGKAANFRR